MIPLSAIVNRVRIRKEAASTIRWSDDSIIESVNDALEDLSEVTRFYERHVTIPVANMRSYYDLRGIWPEEAIGVVSVYSTATEQWLHPTSPRELGSRWEQAVGPPQRFFMRGLYWMGLFPKASAAGTGSLKVYFTAYAPRLTHPQAVLMDLTDDMVFALEDYALYDMDVQDGETNSALTYFGSYTRRSKTLSDFVDRRIVRPRTLRMGVR